MYLVDTNVWLERLLGQQQSETVGQFLEQVPSDRLFVTGFTIHSIGIILARLRRPEVLLLFVQEVFVDGAVILIHLGLAGLFRPVEAMEQCNLDFDDAYQYVAAEVHNLTLVSLDGDFDRTPAGRKAPHELLEGRGFHAR